jgi:hypothetical protein
MRKEVVFVISMSGSVSQAISRLVLVGLLVAAPAAVAVAAAPALQLVGPGQAETVDLSIDELAEMPQTTVRTETEFTDGMVEFRGPLVRDVLENLKLNDLETVRFVAANDYFVDIPTEDFQKYPVILAIEANGKRLSRRDKGPLWLMYPISDYSALRQQIYLRRLIWQVVRIEAQ